MGNIQETYKKEWGDSPFVTQTRPMEPPGVPGVRDKARAGAYSDPEKERRYQEWKARQRQ